jgi:hypothetical protein
MCEEQGTRQQDSYVLVPVLLLINYGPQAGQCQLPQIPSPPPEHCQGAILLPLSYYLFFLFVLSFFFVFGGTGI